MSKKQFFVRFTYTYWCQGWEETTGYVLVYAKDFDEAIIKIKAQYHEASNFENCTLA
jgi:hypothetical protein